MTRPGVPDGHGHRSLGSEPPGFLSFRRETKGWGMKPDGTGAPRKTDGHGRPVGRRREEARRRRKEEVAWTGGRIAFFSALLVTNSVVGWLIVGWGTTVEEYGPGPLTYLGGFMLMFGSVFLVFPLVGDGMLAGLTGLAATFALTMSSFTSAADFLAVLRGEGQDVVFGAGDLVTCAAFLAHIPTIILAARFRIRERERRAVAAARAALERDGG